MTGSTASAIRRQGILARLGRHRRLFNQSRAAVTVTTGTIRQQRFANRCSNTSHGEERDLRRSTLFFARSWIAGFRSNALNFARLRRTTLSRIFCLPTTLESLSVMTFDAEVTP
ncbi:MAG: hypothetical protein P9C55_01465 [Defluviicoccus sp.]|jgi:hypothetical protein|nr:hypothetical protein [Defluviicoccus sp.]HOT82129.1 hypothetical protein [Candidatus Defluviicoccus seviourii]